MPLSEDIASTLKRYEAELNKVLIVKSGTLFDKKVTGLYTTRLKQSQSLKTEAEKKAFLTALNESLVLLQQLQNLKKYLSQFDTPVQIPTSFHHQKDILKACLKQDNQKHYSAYKNLAMKLLSEKNIKPSTSENAKDKSDISLLSSTIEAEMEVAKPSPTIDASFRKSFNTLVNNISEMKKRTEIEWMPVIKFALCAIGLGLTLAAIALGAGGAGLQFLLLGVSFTTLGTFILNTPTSKNELMSAVFNKAGLVIADTVALLRKNQSTGDDEAKAERSP